MSLLSVLKSPSPSRAWYTAPHPRLPIIATCFSDKAVRIYSLKTFTLLDTISGGHKRAVRTCSWKPNLKGESVLATGSFDASVAIWRRWDGDMDLRRENQFIGISTDQSENTEEDDPEEWRFALVLDGHESEVKSVAWSAGGNFIASCSRDKSIWVWEEVGDDDFETVAVMSEHDGDVKCVAWHPEEVLLASGSYDNDVRLWREEDDWGCVEVLRGHESTVWGIEWEKPPGSRLCSCSDDMTIRIWSDSSGWREEAQLPRRHERPIYAVAWKNNRIVSTGGDGRIVVYEERPIGMMESDKNAEPKRNGETSLASADGGHHMSSSPNPDKMEWTVIKQIEAGHGVYEINHVCWASRGNDEDVIVTTGDDGVIRVWTL